MAAGRRGQGWSPRRRPVAHGRRSVDDHGVRTESPTAKVPHAEFFPPPPAPGGPRVWLARIADDRRELVRFWPVVQNMVVQELRVRYQRSMLGFLWTLLNPILMMTTMPFVFSQIFNVPGKNYAVYLFAGMVPWNFLERQPERVRVLDHHTMRG